MAQISPIFHRLKDGTQITVRNAVQPDAEALLACVRAYLTEGSGMVTQLDEMNSAEDEQRERIKGFLENSNDLLLVAEHEGMLIGDLDFRSAKRKILAHGGDFGLAVHPQWRGKGVGPLLLSTLIHWAESNSGIEKINLRVRATNQRAIAIYKKLGFVEEGRCVRELKHANGTYEDELLMARFVR